MLTSPVSPRLAAIVGELDQALEHDCSDYGCDGCLAASDRPQPGYCHGTCRSDQAIAQALKNLDTYRADTGDTAVVDTERPARQILGQLPPDPKATELLTKLFGAENVRPR